MATDSAALCGAVRDTITKQNGLLLASPAIVYREVYSGRDIIAPNSTFTEDKVDDRKYVPVEWWIMSKTQAVNGVMREGEGITKLKLCTGQLVSLCDALAVAETELFGEYNGMWPLTKVLDIGGRAVRPSFSSAAGDGDEGKEVPPIPCHVHAGEVCNGHCQGPGKLEAYFFPPLDVPPYNMKLDGVITRLGLKPDTSKDQIIECLKKFGEDDSMYQLLNVFNIEPWTSWTIREKVVHAPGPWLTFETQRPQDDFNLLAWRLGHALDGEDKAALRSSVHLKGLADDEALLRETIDWQMNTDPEFESKWHRRCEVLSSGDWGRTVRLFYNEFYGVGYEVKPGQELRQPAGDKPIAGIVWSGQGVINGTAVSSTDNTTREFLLCPGHELHLENPAHGRGSGGDSHHTLMIFTVLPMLS